jgi:hypothetical protein
VTSVKSEVEKYLKKLTLDRRDRAALATWAEDEVKKIEQPPKSSRSER